MRLNFLSLLQQGVGLRLLALVPVLLGLWLLVLWALG